MMASTDRLARAKEYLAIAEAGDSKREAYRAAAAELAAYRDESPRKWKAAAASYCNRSTKTMEKLVQWHDTGYEAATPFLMDEKATDRAAVSHGRKVLREQPAKLAPEIAKAMEDPDVVDAVIRDMDDDAISGMVHATAEQAVARRIAADRELDTEMTVGDVVKQAGHKSHKGMTDSLIESWVDTHTRRLVTNARRLKKATDESGIRLSVNPDDSDYDEVLDRTLAELIEARTALDGPIGVLQDRVRARLESEV